MPHTHPMNPTSEPPLCMYLSQVAADDVAHEHLIHLARLHTRPLQRSCAGRAHGTMRIDPNSCDRGAQGGTHAQGGIHWIHPATDACIWG